MSRISLPFHADHLPERMDDFHEIGLRRHHRVNRLVRCRSFVDHILILPALDAFRHPHVILYCKSALGFIARHGPPCAMAATTEALRVSFAANDIRTRTHTAWDDPHIAIARPNGALARDQDVLTEMRLARHVIVVTVDCLQLRIEGQHLARIPDGCDDLLHHQMRFQRA